MKLERLQWAGLFAAPLTWAAQHVIGYGVTQAECGAGGMQWGISNTAWQLSLLAVGGAIVISSEVCAGIVFARTRSVGKDDPPPDGRLHFLSVAALVANPLFLTVMVLDGVTSTLISVCRGG